MNNFIKKDVKPLDGDLKAWCEEQLQHQKGEHLLAFADDGVIWGRIVDAKLDMRGPTLDKRTLQQAFLFGAESEVRLFRDDAGIWQALRVVDDGEWFPESHILWGDTGPEPQGGFAQVSEYRSGITNQILPLGRAFGKAECARLEVHHLVEYDEKTGEARIALSRLAGLSIGPRAMEVEK